ncbi:SAM-dependent methyltransferase [Nocardia fusca]|uniref:SAM-dependent methyltransferase n=1 Tax=Nocardia fusca TaxID=941183 RepID=UPI0037C5B949
MGSAAVPAARPPVSDRAGGPPPVPSSSDSAPSDLPLPTPSEVNTHQATAYMHTLPDADRPTVVYVDRDQVCLAHGRVLLEITDQSHYVHGDLLTRDLDGSEAATYLELEKPVGVLLCGVLHHVDDETDAAEVVRGWVDVVPAG